jgi:hypothetical protein
VLQRTLGKVSQQLFVFCDGSAFSSSSQKNLVCHNACVCLGTKHVARKRIDLGDHSQV